MPYKMHVVQQSESILARTRCGLEVPNRLRGAYFSRSPSLVKWFISEGNKENLHLSLGLTAPQINVHRRIVTVRLGVRKDYGSV